MEIADLYSAIRIPKSEFGTMKITRRDLLKMIGGATFGMALPAEILHALPKEGERMPYEEYWSTGICLQCPSGCGLRIRSVNHWPVKLEGIKDYPINQGRLCPKGQAGLQVLYDPDRIRHPLKRRGKRGEGDWEKISWNDAIGLVAQRLKTLRQEGRPHHLVWMGGRYRGHMAELVTRFIEVFGSPNHLGNPARGLEGMLKGHLFTMGVRDFLAIHWEQVNYVLSFGASLLEASRPSLRNLWGYGFLRRGRPGIRGKLVQVEPRFSITASKADQWIPIQPATDGALALGIAHWIIMERGLKEVSRTSLKDVDHVLGELKVEARGDRAFLPHFEKPRSVGNEKEYPFHLINYKLMTMAEGRGANQPYLQEIIGPHLYERWESWVEINPKTAESLGIKDGDVVWVESPAGKVKTKARLFPGTHPNCIHIPYGQGHKAYGRWAKGRGVNPNDLLATDDDYLGGFVSYYSTRVKVYKA